MNTLEIPLTEKLQRFVESEAASGGHASANDYVLALLQELQKKRGMEKLEKLIIEGLESGEPIVADKAFWEEMHRKLRERHPEVDNP